MAELQTALSAVTNHVPSNVHDVTVQPPLRTQFKVTGPPVPAALNSRAAATFSGLTGRSVTSTNLTGHLEDCCHLVAAHNDRKTDLMGSIGIQIKRPVPATAIQIIARRMAPVGNQLHSVAGLFPGRSAEAVKQRKAVGIVMEDVFDQANIVAVERINRGSALDRRQRESEGKALSAQERQESMQRESNALARIAVLSGLIGRGADALGKLQVGVQVPQLAQNIVQMTALDLATATATAKSILTASISQSQFKLAEDKRNKQQSSTSAHFARQYQQNNGGSGGGGRGGRRGRGRGRGRSRGRGRRGRRRRGRRGRRRACHRCGSTDHLVFECPQPVTAAAAAAGDD